MHNIPLLSIVISLTFLGCHAGGQFVKRAVVPTDVQIMRYHVGEYYTSLEEFTRRLYLKNPKYEKDLEMRKKKIRGIFQGEELPYTDYNNKPSHKLLEAAFATIPTYEDRVFLLSLGLVKSIEETYSIKEKLVVTSMEVSLEKLTNLYHNISHQAEMFWGNMQCLAPPALAAAKANVPVFVQVSTVCVYPDAANDPALEMWGHLKEPEQGNAGYALAKRMGERICHWAFEDSDTRYVIVRPTNQYSERDYFDETAHVIPALPG